jgi:hypothetical protein
VKGHKHNDEATTLIPKGRRMSLLKIASKQPLLKTRQIVRNWNQFWYFQPKDLTICRIITFKVEEKVFFASVQGGQQYFGVQKNHLLK